MLPTDPFMLLSYINTKLRDEYSSLDRLAYDMDEDKAEIIRRLKGIGYEYDERKNRFL